MNRTLAVLMVLGLANGAWSWALAQEERGGRDRRDGRESRASEREDRPREGRAQTRENNRGNDEGRNEEETDRPSRNRGRASETRENDGNAPAASTLNRERGNARPNDAGRVQEERRGNNLDRSSRSAREERGNDRSGLGIRQGNQAATSSRPSQGDSNDASNVRSAGTTRQGNNVQRRSYQWRDRNEERLGRERGWDRPVRLTETARQRGIRELPQRITDRNQYVTTRRDRSVIQHPDRDWQGRAISARRVDRGDDRVVVNHMRRISGNTTIINNINIYNTRETRVGHYYWHNDGGSRYCHYRDRWGYRWFGWYVGSHYFWTRYHSGRFWWYDSSFDRWCYWNNGYWWWQDPYRTRVIYMYDNTRYIQAVSDDELEVGLPEEADDDSYAEGSANVKVFRSKDESRMVKVIGRDQEAFLYDIDGSESFKPMYLGNRVKEVKFSNTLTGRPLQVMLVFKDDSFELFDSRGRSMGEREF